MLETDMHHKTKTKEPRPVRLTSALALAGLALTGSLLAQATSTPEQEATGTRTSPPPAPSSATARPTNPPIETSDDEDVIMLSPFEVTESSTSGYMATQTLAGSRINTKLEDVGSAISVVTAEFMRDVGATDNKSLLMYTTNTEVGGVQGNFRGASGGQSEDESGRFTNPNGNTRVRGLTSADNTRNFFISDIPWEGYNIDRVDLQRGPNSILFGLGSPAGIINTTLKSAVHRNFGEVDLRFGSYGGNRQSLDYNLNLLKDELSVRIAAVRNEEKYKQKPAFSLDRRAYGTVRYDPQFLARNGHRTTLKANFETGKIRSNNPRTITPLDLVSAWWTELDKQTFNPNTVQDSSQWYDANGVAYWPENIGQYNRTRTGGGANPYYEPWLGAPQMYGGVWIQSDRDADAPFSASMPEFKDIKGIGPNGNTDGGIGGHPFSRRVTVASTAYYAERDPTAKYQSWGLWKSTSLTDPSVYDFYNNLLDGHNKREWQEFRNFSASLSQTFFRETFGFEAAYDTQSYKRGQYSFNGGGAIYVDINSHNIDGTPNPNVGRAYIEGNNTWGNNRTKTDRDAARLSAFFNHDFNKGGRGNWIQKLAGRHTLSGLLSKDTYRSDGRAFKRYGTTDEFGSLVATGTNASYLDSNERALTTLIYISDDLSGLSSPGGAIRNGGREVVVPDTVSWRYFDSTWNAPGVNPADPWINTRNGATSTQSENPANYVGWRNRDVEVLSAERGDEEALTFGATLNKRQVNSKAAVIQSYFWDGAVVGMYGIRNDKVKSWAYDGIRVNNRVNFDALDSEGRIQYGTEGKPYSLYEANSPSWSIVTKLNRFLNDRLPVNVNLYYNESQNFQITGTRNNIYGQPLPAPSGKTQDMGIMLSTKDDRFVLRVNKYETEVNDATNTTGIPTWYLLGGGNFIQRQEDRADAYEYRLGRIGDPTSVGLENAGWDWSYDPDTSKGETQADADARAAAAVAAWRAYTNEPIVQRIRQAWGFNDFNVTQTTTMSTPVANFLATEDQISKGMEYEFTANPTRNWRISINASETKASRKNIGGAELQEFIDLTNRYHNGPMGDIRQWGGGAITSTALVSWNSNFYSKYLLMKLQEGTYSSELRKWRYNVVTNYRFTDGLFKGFNVGVGYRWQDKVAIGYPVIETAPNQITFDLDNPFYGPRQDAIDFWVGYERKLTNRINWSIQLNVRNLGDGNKLIPLSTQWDGTPAAYGIAPGQTWTVSNSFKF